MKIINWVLENFGSIILFQITQHFYGLKPAIAAALVFSVVQIILLKLKKRHFNSFMIISFVLICGFGLVDLLSTNNEFFKYESGILSLLMGAYFGASLFRPKSLVEEVSEQQGRVSTEPSPDKTFFFRLITLFWLIYFVAKALIYFWIALNSSIEVSFIFRMIFGTGSFYILLAVTIGFSQKIWNLLLKLKWMPSTRGE
ncbi:septation protein IspZ [Bdellovibrio sp. HCB288]|uniref:septation protein IspZ n=1 Tax=Bdellovibrio sp. HCB288 TaxID=3394355 RepID=UPI0039B4D0CE